ncbi:TPA: hypothetical protein MCW23_004212 [Klebsiella pneumoniae]|nr:hypothetical protein [Klebsiella pneumoniae]
MTNITELAQLRGRTVDYPYYLVECDCGKIYPSSELSGGEPMGDSGDYSDCYCPHCGEGEEHFEECADPETAWKAQQDKIDALVEALEKAQQRISQLESRTVTVKLPPHAPENLACCLDGYETWLIATTFRDTWNKCLEEVMRTGGAGIKWEAE